MTCTNYSLFTHSPAELISTSILLWTACLSHLEHLRLVVMLLHVSLVMICESWVAECWLPASHDPRGDSWYIPLLLLLSSIFTRSGSDPTSHVLSFIFIVRESLQSDLYLFHLQFHSVILFHLVKPWLRFPFAWRAGALPAIHHNRNSNITAYEP